MSEGFRYALDAAVGHFLPQEFARKPASGQLGFVFDEDEHPRESEAHDGKRPGEFSPKTESTTSTTVDKSEPPADTDSRGENKSESEEKKVATITIKGTTYRAANKLKSMGFVFQPDSKSWKLEAIPGKSTFGQEGFLDSKGNFIGSEESILHSVKAYAKSHDLVIATSDSTASPSASSPVAASVSPKHDAEKTTEGQRRFTKRRGTRDEYFHVGGSVNAPDGSIHIITSVDRPRFDDERSDYIHGVTTRPATAEESARVQKAAEITKLKSFLETRRHGPDDDRDREAYNQATNDARKRLSELEGQN